MISKYHSIDPRLDVEAYIHRLSPSRPWYERRFRRYAPNDAVYQRCKRLIDVVLCLLALPFVVPVLMVCGIAVKLDTAGPMFFIQERTGRGGRNFSMYKIRTMVASAQEAKAQYLHLNELSYPDFKISNDPRITRVGRLLRKTSLDELPQIFNVLRGEMSLVGPRPTSFDASTYSLWHTARLESKPGITGLWQVSGRNDLDFDQRVRLDIAYVRNRSLWLDVRVLFRTLGCLVSQRGAY